MKLWILLASVPWWVWVLGAISAFVVGVAFDCRNYHRYQVPWENKYRGTGQKYPGDKIARKQLKPWEIGRW